MDDRSNKSNSSEMLERMSLDELKNLRKKLDRAIASYETRKRQQALSALEQAARDHGFRLSELMSDRQSGKSKPRAGDAGPDAAPAYVNPENPEQTWSGRGRRPRWVNDALEAGRTLDDLAA